MVYKRVRGWTSGPREYVPGDETRRKAKGGGYCLVRAIYKGVYVQLQMVFDPLWFETGNGLSRISV